MCRVGKAKRAHHLSEIVGVNGGHAALCPPYESYESRSFRTFANTLRNISGVSTRVFVL